MAMYAVGFGLFIIWVIRLGLGDPLWWVGFDIDDQNLFALTLIGAGFIHSLGIAINGSWKWSPALRLTGMGLHAGAISFLVLTIADYDGGHGIPSGLYQYSVAASILWFLTAKCATDLRDSLAIWRLCQ